MSFIEKCCNTHPVQAEYTPTGETFKLKDDLDCYSVGNSNSKAAIIFIYDMFCLHPNAYQGCDILAKSGFRVFMPDFLRNDQSIPELLGQQEKLMEYFIKKGTYEAIKDDVKATKDHIKNVEGFDDVFIVGFCWGGKMGMAIPAHDSFYKGSALVHPSLMEPSDFENVQCPIILLPSKHENDFTEDFAVTCAKPFGNLCYQQRFDDMDHGWCASRGDWSDPLIASRANEAFSIIVTSFNKILKA
ncbi:hypothetical protein BB558_001712 [Smittium angustum]|uniref:Dienelactone hydrolase domain-containing protein n=1 Tax=Smittium angustum TaxID=133377 RepID=A0A2U1JAM0_SMIAN|nr:hypothetical protein BB558_001712 [Smittium angustum]